METREQKICVLCIEVLVQDRGVERGERLGEKVVYVCQSQSGGVFGRGY